jgi:radical SAM superfamily enzyme YgiQ (UPF0313 family)
MCAYCDINAGWDSFAKRTDGIVERPRYRQMTPEKAVEVVEETMGRYKTKYFSFSDESLSPNFMKQFSRLVIEKGLGIKWDCYASFEKQFLDEDFCRTIAKAGCYFIQWGLESTSPKTYEKMGKTANRGVEHVERILENTARAGIWNHTFIINGFPGESASEAVCSLVFLEKDGKSITTIKPTTFKLSRWSPAALNPEKFGIDVLKSPEDLNPNLDFSYRGGQSHKLVEAIRTVYELWVKLRHPVNRATREYMYQQREFLTYDELMGMAGKRDECSYVYAEKEKWAMRRVYNALVAENPEMKERFPKPFSNLGELIEGARWVYAKQLGESRNQHGMEFMAKRAMELKPLPRMSRDGRKRNLPG